ncbi:acyl carrier protein [Kitasatospora gansuensis]|uniref:Acyl carrier protein n=1 Tax=Kitasatospora gansuensis TaxID=258050 RepID=A0A7W7WED7_9ACTN|nr:acyl carrier protein [Kitasatospora gansuensis]MBB4944667.1 acyl carrier protein [Kitasatospora gansuensis]
MTGAPLPDRADVLPDRAEVLTVLAQFHDRSAEAVDEELGSLELTWLIAEFEQRYGDLELPDEAVDAVRTVTDAVELLRTSVELLRSAVGPVGPAGPAGRGQP